MKKMLEFYKNNQVWVMVLSLVLSLSGFVFLMLGDPVLGGVLMTLASPLLFLYYYEKKKSLMAAASIVSLNSLTLLNLNFISGLISLVVAVLLVLASRESEK
jgi:hypothetical protein